MDDTQANAVDLGHVASLRACLPPAQQPQFVTVLRLDHRFRRLAVLAAVALVFGVAAHGACQAIEHHDGIADFAALCAAAVVLVAAVGLVGGSRRGLVAENIWWFSVEGWVPTGMRLQVSRSSAAWLQRFQN